ncbi:MAG TPA: cytochrome D1 domain-containing protein, partial [Planctomycetota bacterium]|nr:cytochrome D1 domain-containing protein [Planctomycetota bacterium]
MRSLIRSSLVRLLFAVVPLALATGIANAAPKVYVGNFKDNTVSVIDTATGTVVATIPVAPGPHGISVTPDGRRVFVSGDSGSGVSVIDTATDRVIEVIEVGKAPHGLAITPDGNTLLVGVYGENRVAFVDVLSNAVVATVPVPKPHTIAIRPDGKTAYVASQEPGKFALVVVDLTSRSVVRAVTLERAPRDPEFGFDGKALYFTLAGVNAVEVLDPTTDKVVAEVPTGVSPHLAKLYRDASLGAAVVQGPGELQLFNPATNKVVRTIAVGKQPHWQASNDGKKVYVANEGSNDVTVVDLGTGDTTRIPVGAAPRKIVVQPAPLASGSGPRVSIANFAFAPETLTVGVGETVTWVNEDGAPHGLSYKDGAKGVDPLLPGARFGRTFDKP